MSQIPFIGRNSMIVDSSERGVQCDCCRAMTNDKSCAIWFDGEITKNTVESFRTIRLCQGCYCVEPFRVVIEPQLQRIRQNTDPAQNFDYEILEEQTKLPDSDLVVSFYEFVGAVKALKTKPQK